MGQQLGKELRLTIFARMDFRVSLSFILCRYFGGLEDPLKSNSTFPFPLYQRFSARQMENSETR